MRDSSGLRSVFGKIPMISVEEARNVNFIITLCGSTQQLQDNCNRIGNTLGRWLRENLPHRFRIQLRIQTGENAEQLIMCPQYRDLIIGRSRSADIQIADPEISAMHIRLSADAETRLKIEDLESANGVVVNGERLEGSRICPWPGDHVCCIGETRIRISRTIEQGYNTTVTIDCLNESGGIAWVGDEFSTGYLCFEFSMPSDLVSQLYVPVKSGSEILGKLLDLDLGVDSTNGHIGPVERTIWMELAHKVIQFFDNGQNWKSVRVKSVLSLQVLHRQQHLNEHVNGLLSFRVRIFETDHVVYLGFRRLKLKVREHQHIRTRMMANYTWSEGLLIECAVLLGEVPIPRKILRTLTQGDAIIMHSSGGFSQDNRLIGCFLLAFVSNGFDVIGKVEIVPDPELARFRIAQIAPVNRTVAAQVLCGIGEQPNMETEPNIQQNDQTESVLNSAIIDSLMLNLTVELGRLQLPLSRIIHLQPGEIIQFPRPFNETVEIYCGSQRFASGRILQVGDQLGVQIVELRSGETEL